MLQQSQAFGSFSVKDMREAGSFYRDILGLDVTENSMGVLELHFSNGAHMIVYPKPDHVPATFTVLNFPVAEIEKTVDELGKRGIVFEQYEAPIKTNEKGICRANGGPGIAWFKDPSGNIMSVIGETHR